jgi:lipopolysaccharide export system protein LptA
MATISGSRTACACASTPPSQGTPNETSLPLRRPRSGSVLAAGLVSAAAAQTQNPFGGFKHDNTQPIEITADSLEVREAEQRAIFAGEVVAGQGDLRLTAETLNVWYAEDGGETGAIERVRAEGDVFLSSGAETARGEWAEYEVTSGLVTMGGGVTLAQGENAIKGERLFVDLTQGTGRIEGGRVRSVFNPASANQ